MDTSAKAGQKDYLLMGQNQLSVQCIITNMRTLGSCITHLNPGSREFVLI